MSKQPSISIVGAVLALAVLGCRNRSDETNAPGSTESTPPLVEDDDALGDEDDDDLEHDGHDPGAPQEAPPPAGEPETSPVDPDMP